MKITIHLTGFLVAYLFFACSSPVAPDGDIALISKDTITIAPINYSYGGKVIKTIKNQEKLHLAQGHQLWVISMESGEVDLSVDLDTTSLILPNESLCTFFFKDSTWHLLFPFSKKIVVANANFSEGREIALKGLPNYLMPNNYWDYFHKIGSYYSIGLWYDSFVGEEADYYEKIRHLALFDTLGNFAKAIGEVDERIKEANVEFMSQGSFVMAIKDERIALKNSAGTSKVDLFDLEGNFQESFFMSSEEIDFSIPPPRVDGNMDLLNSTLDLKWIDDHTLASLTFIEPEPDLGLKEYQILLVHNLEEKKSYSVQVEAYQRLIRATKEHLYLIRVHPDQDELIIIKLGYTLLE